MHYLGRGNARRTTERSWIAQVSQRRNHRSARAATCSSVPGSSNRWPAPGTISSRTSHASLRSFVEFDNDGIPRADDEQRGGRYERQRSACEVGAPAPRHDRVHFAFGARSERRRGACACAKVTSFQVRGPVLAAEPASHAGQAARQQIDVEPKARVLLVTQFLVGREQVEEKGAEPTFREVVRDVDIAPAETAAAAAVGKQHDASRARRQHDVTLQYRVADVDGCMERSRFGLPHAVTPRNAARASLTRASSQSA